MADAMELMIANVATVKEHIATAERELGELEDIREMCSKGARGVTPEVVLERLLDWMLRTRKDLIVFSRNHLAELEKAIHAMRVS